MKVIFHLLERRGIVKYQFLVNSLIREKGLRCSDNHIRRTQMISDTKGRTIELSYSVLESIGSQETYQILKSIFY